MRSYLTKALVLPFYKRHAVFFAVLFFCAFSFLSGRDHLELAKALLASDQLMAVLALLFTGWSAYLLYWLRKLLRRPEQIHTSLLSLLPPGKRSRYLLWLSVQLMSPLLVYAGLLLYAGQQTNRLPQAASLATWGLLLTIGLAVLIHAVLRRPAESSPRNLLSVTFFSSMFLRYYGRSNPWALLLGLLASLTFWLGCLSLSRLQAYDARFLYLMALSLAGLHMPIVQGLIAFERQAGWLRQLPVSRWKQLAEETLLFGLFLLPEVVLGFVFYPDVEGREGLLLSVLALLALRALCYIYHRFPPAATALGFLLYFFLILFSVPIYLLSIPLLLLILLAYLKGWFHYEAPVQE